MSNVSGAFVFSFLRHALSVMLEVFSVQF